MKLIKKDKIHKSKIHKKYQYDKKRAAKLRTKKIKRGEMLKNLNKESKDMMKQLEDEDKFREYKNK